MRRRPDESQRRQSIVPASCRQLRCRGGQRHEEKYQQYHGDRRGHPVESGIVPADVPHHHGPTGDVEDDRRDDGESDHGQPPGGAIGDRGAQGHGEDLPSRWTPGFDLQRFGDGDRRVRLLDGSRRGRHGHHLPLG